MYKVRQRYESIGYFVAEIMEFFNNLELAASIPGYLPGRTEGKCIDSMSLRSSSNLPG